MEDQNSAPIEATPERTQDWYASHNTTPEEQEATQWAGERERSIEADRTLKQALGLEFEVYKKHIESLSVSEREELAKQDGDKIREALDKRADTESELEKLNKEQKKQRELDEEELWNDTSEARHIRKAMKKAYQEAESLDERIVELQILNELRLDPSDERWDKLPEDKWRLAREGNTESLDGEIQALIQQKQAKLQEVALHQNAYHAGIQNNHVSKTQEIPIGHILDATGQQVQLTRSDIAALVAAERDEQEHIQRLTEAREKYPDWEASAIAAVRAGVDVTAQQAAFIKTLPNSADVSYYLVKNHQETRALAHMSNEDAWRALMNISHRIARENTAYQEPKKTSAPKPPSPVGGGSSKAFDVSDESLSSEEWMRKRNADLKRRGKA